MSFLSPLRLDCFRALFSGRFLALLAFTFTPDALLAAKWPALDPADLAARTPSVDPEAGAEILLREVELDDSDPEVTALEYFLRIKIFSERSLADFSKIEIFHGRNERISNIMARTHRPDGTVVELTRKDIFERDVIKTGDYRQKVKSFAPPDSRSARSSNIVIREFSKTAPEGCPCPSKPITRRAWCDCACVSTNIRG